VPLSRRGFDSLRLLVLSPNHLGDGPWLQPRSVRFDSGRALHASDQAAPGSGFLHRMTGFDSLRRLKCPRPGGSWRKPPKLDDEVRLLARAPANCPCPGGSGRRSTKPVVQVRLLAGAPRLRPGGSGHRLSIPAISVQFRAKAQNISGTGRPRHDFIRRRKAVRPCRQRPFPVRLKAKTRSFDLRYGGSSPSPGTMCAWRNGRRTRLRPWRPLRTCEFNSLRAHQLYPRVVTGWPGRLMSVRSRFDSELADFSVCAGGGMADALARGASGLKTVRVRVPLCARFDFDRVAQLAEATVLSPVQ
jgi:hypothetical protein